MLEFLRRNRLLATAALFLVLAAGLILRTGTTRGRDDQLGRIFLELMAPLDRAGTFASRTVAEAWQGAAALMRARDEAEALRGRVRQLEQDTARLAETEAENARLRTLLDFRRTLGGKLITARVIGHDAAGVAPPPALAHGAVPHAGPRPGVRGWGRKRRRHPRPRGHRRTGLPGESARRPRAPRVGPQQRRRRRGAAHARSGHHRRDRRRTLRPQVCQAHRG